MYTYRNNELGVIVKHLVSDTHFTVMFKGSDKENKDLQSISTFGNDIADTVDSNGRIIRRGNTAKVTVAGSKFTGREGKIKHIFRDTTQLFSQNEQNPCEICRSVIICKPNDITCTKQETGDEPNDNGMPDADNRELLTLIVALH